MKVGFTPYRDYIGSRLETLNVGVLGYGTDEFPSFYRRSSGLPVDRRFDEVETDLAVN